MANCTIVNDTELNNYMKNRLAIYKFSNPDLLTAEDVRKFLDHSNSIVKSEKTSDERYMFTTGHILSNRVTDASTRKFEAGKTKEYLDRIRATSEFKVDFGSFMHNVKELLGRSIANKDAALEEVAKDLALNGMHGYKLSPLQFRKLKKGVTEVIEQAQEIQRIINKENGTDGIVTFHFEQFLFDPKRDLGGSSDIIAIFSDRSAAIYDYKTKTGGKKVSSVDKLNLKDYRNQIGTYKKILIDRYGVKFIRQGRIIPVYGHIDPKTREIKDIFIGSGVKALFQIPVVNESTTLRALDNMLAKLYDDRNAAEERGSVDRVQKIDEQIYSVLVSKDYGFIIKRGVELAKTLNKKHEKGEVLDNADIAEIKMIRQFIEDFRVGINDAVKKELVESVQENFLTELSDEIILLDAMVGDIENIIVNQAYEKLRSYGHVRKENGAIVQDNPDSYMQLLFNEFSELRSPALRYAHDKVSQAHTARNQSLKALEETVAKIDDEVYKWLQSKGQSYERLADYLVDKTNGNLIRPIGKEFFDKRHDAREQSDYKWFFEYHEKKDYYDEWYKKELKKKEDFWRSYYSFLPAAEKANRSAEKIREWKTNNDLSLDANGKPVFAEAWASRHVKPNAKAKEQFKDARYAVIEANKPLLDYYNMWTNMMDKISVDTEVELTSEFIPWIRRDMIERFIRSENPVQDIISNAQEMFNVRVDDEGFGMMDEDASVSRKEGRKSIPLLYTNRFFTKEGGINYEEKSYDLTKSLYLFAYSAYNYQNMKAIEDEMIALKTLVGSSRFQNLQRSPDGKKLLDQFNSYVALGSDKVSFNELDTSKVLETLLDHYLYGISTIQKGKTVAGINTVQLAQKVYNFKALNALGLNVLASGASYVAANVFALTEGLKGNIYDSKAYGSALKKMATENKKSLALFHYLSMSGDRITENMHLSAKNKNTVFVLGDSKERSFVRKWVNTQSLMSVWKTGEEATDLVIMLSMAETYKVNIKTGNVRHSRNVDADNTDYVFIKDVLSYDNEEDAPSITLIENEAAIRKFMTAFKTAVRAGQRRIKGSMGSDERSYAQSNIYLKMAMQFKNWMPGVMGERLGSMQYNKSLDVFTYGKFRAFENELSSSSAGLASFLTEGLIPTIKEVSKDLLLNTITLGYVDNFKYSIKKRYHEDAVYKNRVDLWVAEFKERNAYHYQDMLDSIGDVENKEEVLLEKMLEIRERAIRSAMTEIRIIMVMLSMLMFLRGEGDDDKPRWKSTWLHHKIFQLTNRVLTETSFTVNPFEFQKLLKNNVVPAFGVVLDVGKLLHELMDESLELVVPESLNKRDDASLQRAFYKMFPGLAQLMRLSDFDEADANSPV